LKVFLTDASYKHTLGAMRSLGSKGFYVAAGSESKLSQCFYSKYCSRALLYPSPQKKRKFTDSLFSFFDKNRFDVLLPIGYLSMEAISENKEILSKKVKIPISDYESFKIAANKYETIKLAKEVKVNIPKTIYLDRIGKLDLKDLKPPFVIKPIRESGGVFYLKNKNNFDKLKKRKINNIIIQEYVEGDGYGFFGLFNKGKLRAYFMHKRLREYPLSGGPSTLAESIYDPKLKEQGLKILRQLNWHGVAMVEFKKDKNTGEFLLMEINPKFWGSLDLAIASGVDFPYLACKMAVDGDIKPVSSYKVGLKFKWPFPDDTLHLISNLKILPHYFLDFFRSDTITNVMLKDLKPNAIQLIQTMTEIINRK
jgi:predicted ATP-grasp superfamily ATP-dependent carboligase